MAVVKFLPRQNIVQNSTVNCRGVARGGSSDANDPPFERQGKGEKNS